MTTFGDRSRYTFGGTYYPEVANFNALPAVAGHAGSVYLVLAGQWSGLFYHRAGLYRSDGATWTRLAPLTTISDEKFALFDEGDNTKGAMFECSGITTGTTHVYTFPDATGTLALQSWVSGAYVPYTGATTSVDLGAQTLTTTGNIDAGFTLGSVVFEGASGLAEDNTNLFWDDTNKRLGIGVNTGFDPRIGLTISGDVDILHTATEADDHTLELDVDAAGFGDVKALDIDYITGTVATGEDEGIILINIDEIAATGGNVLGVEVLTTEGAAASTVKTYGLKVGALVGAIHQDSGIFELPTLGTNNTPSTNVPFMIDGIIGNTTAIFQANGEYIIIGAAAAFEEIEFILTTTASNPGIKPTFWYSSAAGGGFTQFTPVDGTNGFRNTGVVAWDASDLVGHIVGGVTTTFDIKIIRTQPVLGTEPVLGYAKTAATTEYVWDKDGDINIKDLTASGTITGENITISSPIPILVLKDSTYVGDVSLGYIEWRDKNNTRLGFFGNSSSGNDDLYWKNESSGGHILIETTGAGEFQILANIDIGGGEIDGVTIGTNSPCTELQVDNINLNTNTISTTGALHLNPSSTGIDCDNKILLNVNKLGVGISTVQGLAHIYAGDSGASGGAGYAADTDMFIEDDDHVILMIVTPSTKQGLLGFADEGDTYVGGVTYDHSQDKMWLYVNNGVRVNIDSTGDMDVVADFTAGTIQADNGFDGTWVNAEGDTVTVVGGVITSVEA